MRLVSTPRRRAGFTLVELLVVIAIIAILVALLMSGVFYAYIRMQHAGADADIKRMSVALDTFKKEFNIYPPSRIRLCSNRSTYTLSPTPPPLGGPALDSDSIAMLNAMWPSIGDFSGIKWDGANTNVDVILEGDQCLVYFLTGIPTGGLPNGFSINPKDPSFNQGGGRKGPFYTFESNRLKPRPGAIPQNQANTFLSYLDYYGNAPYIYFGSGLRKNGFPPNYTIFGVYAYRKNNQFYNPESCQIICAGRNATFGTPANGQWTPAAAGNIGAAGADDRTNFYEFEMGVQK